MLPFSETYRPSKNFKRCQQIPTSRKKAEGSEINGPLLLKCPYLTNILVSDSADLLDICRALGNILQRVSAQLKLILLVLGNLDIDTWLHSNATDNLLSDEVTDLNLGVSGLGVLLNVDVDWEMGIDVTHLVEEALGNTDDHVVDEGTDGAESGDILAGTVVELNVDDVLLWVGEVDCEMGEVLGELACCLLGFSGRGMSDCLLRFVLLSG
jgi:hypothetical protein